MATSHPWGRIERGALRRGDGTVEVRRAAGTREVRHLNAASGTVTAIGDRCDPPSAAPYRGPRGVPRHATVGRHPPPRPGLSRGLILGSRALLMILGRPTVPGSLFSRRIAAVRDRREATFIKSAGEPKIRPREAPVRAVLEFEDLRLLAAAEGDQKGARNSATSGSEGPGGVRDSGSFHTRSTSQASAVVHMTK